MTDHPASGSQSTLHWWVPAGAGAAALGILALALTFGHGLDATTITGLPDPGRFTTWALPVTTVALNVLGTVTVGLCVTAAFLLPGDGRTVSAHGYRLLRRAAGVAGGWAVAALALIALTVSDILGQPLSRVGLAATVSFATSVSQGQALAIQAGLAVAVAALTWFGISRTTAATAAVLAVVTVLPPKFTGHAAGAGNHQIAVTSLAVHVAAAALWVGGLAALLTLRRSRHLPNTAARYSRLALFCFAAVAISGLANALVRLGHVDQL